jgi:hypothetical protein
LRVGDDRPELLGWNFLNLQERARPRPEQHLVFNNVPNAGENRLVKEHVGNFNVRKGANFF